MNPEDSTENERDDMHYGSLLGAAAFGTLSAEEGRELQAYLATSEVARAELAQLRIIAGDLSLLVDEREPSPDVRRRIEQAIMAGSRAGRRQVAAPLAPTTGSGSVRPLEISSQPSPTPISKAPGWRNYIWAAAASLLIAVLAGVMLDRIFLQETDDDLDGRQTIAYELTLPAPPPDLSAELTYDPDRQLFVLETENMPDAPEGQIYQIWLIDADGPKPVGMMARNDSSVAVAANRDDYATFAITVEPGPIGSPAPTTDPFFVAALGPADNSG